MYGFNTIENADPKENGSENKEITNNGENATHQSRLR